MADNDQERYSIHNRNDQTGQSVVLGIGTGQCGMRALAECLNRQPDACVTLEERPLLPWRPSTGRPGIRERLLRFHSSRPQQYIGDVASFYLNYIEEAITIEPDVRVICLKMPREEVVASYCRWLDAVHPVPVNHWASPPPDGWHHDPILTRIFPQYDARDREEGIRRYWEEYYQAADVLVRRFPKNIRIFSTRETFETEAGMRDLLTFGGIPPERQVLSFEGWAASDLPGDPHPRRTACLAAGRMDPRRCVVLVPYTGSILPACETALRNLEQRGYEVWRVSGFAAIDEGRSRMATAALVEGFEETMWIDSDVEFETDAVDRLRSHGEPIVCGIYPQKGRRALACHAMPGTEKLVFGGTGGLAEILYSAGGFLLVRRQVYMDIQSRLDLPVCNEQFGRPLIPFFQPMIRLHHEGTWYLAEDYAFCERARQCGYRVLADTTVRLWHLGSYSFTWEDAIFDRDRYANVTIYVR
jgi:hypothetical protein